MAHAGLALELQALWATMKKTTRPAKLELHAHALRTLSAPQLVAVAGGASSPCHEPLPNPW